MGQGEFFHQGKHITVMKPGGQAQGSAGRIDVWGGQAGMDKVPGFLDLGINQARFGEAGGFELIEINHIDQADYRCRTDPQVFSDIDTILNYASQPGDPSFMCLIFTSPLDNSLPTRYIVHIRYTQF